MDTVVVALGGGLGHLTMGLTSPVVADIVTNTLTTWAATFQSWMKYLMIIAVVIGFILFLTGHRSGWAHMRESLIAGIFVFVVIGLIATFFP